jgi:hypothetical protein
MRRGERRRDETGGRGKKTGDGKAGRWEKGV